MRLPHLIRTLRAFAKLFRRRLRRREVFLPDGDGDEVVMMEEFCVFDLFLRLKIDKCYYGLVFGDISAMTQLKRIGALALLENKRDTNPPEKHGNIPL